MDRNRLPDPTQVPVRPLDLIYRGSAVLHKDPVRPAFYHKLIASKTDYMGQTDLRAVFRSHTALDFPVHAAARLHRILRLRCMPVINIPAPHKKLHQSPD